MKAYLLTRSGRPNVLKIHNVSEPWPEKHEVKIKVETIGINYAETLSRRGQYGWAPKKPYVPGMEAYGEVVAIGEEVSKFKLGEKIIVGQQYGNYAEYACASEHLCFHAISSYSPEENAAFLVNFMTAWIALKRLCRVSAGEDVLIQAAAGGVGTAAVQLSKKMGCKVYGTASNTEKLNLIENLGVDLAINYAKDDFYEEILKQNNGVDCVLEVVGGEVFKKSIKLLKPFGRIAVIGFASINIHWWNPVSWWRTWRDAPKVRLMNMAKRSQGIFASHIGYLTEERTTTIEVWEELCSFTKLHQLRPVIGGVFNFEELPQAHTFLESRNSTGKIVVKV